MLVSRRASVSETTSLLEESPPSYHSIDDIDEEASEPEAYSDPQPLNVFSKWDTFWILAGLWSVVLLGAFDGKCKSTYFYSSNSESCQERSLRHCLRPSEASLMLQINHHTSEPHICYRYAVSPPYMVTFSTNEGRIQA